MISDARHVLRSCGKALLVLCPLALLLAQGHVNAQQQGDNSVVVIQKALAGVEESWLQFSAEETLITKVQELPGWQVAGWVPPAGMTEEQSLDEIRKAGNARWVFLPDASQTAEQTKVSVRILDLRKPEQPKTVEAAERPGRLPSLLLRALDLTLGAVGVEKDKIRALDKTGLGTYSSLALERYYRASTLWLLGQREDALAAYESSLAAGKDFEPARRSLANGRYDLAQQAYVQSKWDDAATLFQQSGEVFQYLSTKNAERLAQAVSDADKKNLQSQIDSDDASRKICETWTHLCQGLVQRDAGNSEGAKSEFEAALALDKNFPPALSAEAGLQLQQAQQGEEKGDFSTAENAYQAAAEAYSSLGDLSNEGLALAGASRCAEKQGQAEDAIGLLLEAAKRYTSADDYRAARGLLLGPSYGLASTFGLIDDNSSRSKAHFLLAVGFMRCSEKSLREQCDAPPDGTLRFIPTGEVIADADLSRWKMEKALDEAMKATNLDPKDAASFLLLGRVYLLTEKPDALSKAIEAFSTARDLKPDSIEPAVMLGDTLYQANQLTEAEETLVAACKIPIESGQEYWGNRAWASLGRVSNRVRKYDQAAQAFEKAVAYRSTDAISYFGWATALFHLNRFQEAKEKLQQAKQLAPWLPGTDELQQSLDKAMAASTPAPS